MARIGLVHPLASVSIGSRGSGGFRCYHIFRYPILYFQLVSELLRVESVIVSMQAQEFGMGSLLGDPTLLNNKNAIGATNGAEPVSDYE